MTQNLADTKSASKTNTKASRTFQQLNLVKADNGKVDIPTRIEVVRAGSWPNSVKGNLVITTADLTEMKSNFDKGIGIPSGLGMLPIDFSHADYAEAAGWIKGLEVDGSVLYADVEWSTAGEDALRGGLYKCFSPAFYPGCMGEYHDPEDFDTTAKNVLEGGGLTNIPFFKGLTPIKASTSNNGDGDKNVIYINASKEGEKSMTLAEILAKANDDLSEDERQYLAEHKTELSAEDLTKFGLEAPKNEQQEDEEQDEQQEEVAAENQEVKLPEAVAASLKAANVVMVKADRLNALEATADAYRTEKAESEVLAHIGRGALKADQKDAWTKRILADNSVIELLKALPDNKILADEIGTAANVNTSAWDQISTKASKIVADSDGKVAFGDAVKEVNKHNPELAKAYADERNQN